MKTLRLASVIVALVLSTNSNAALIDNGSYTTDTASRLDWLDLSITAGQTYNSAEILNSGWRYATNDEVEDLHNTLFSHFPDEDFAWAYSGGYSSQYDGGHYNGMLEEIATMETLFGISFENNYMTKSSGIYLDEDSKIMVFGSQRHYNEPYSEPYDWVQGLDYTGPHRDSWEMMRTEEGHDSGIMLVRTSVVPVPAAVWLFGSGLIGLIGVARRKKT